MSRVALVTGASRGIGYATALELAKQGVHVVVLARSQAGLEALDDEIKKAGGACTLMPYDLLKGDLIEGLGPVLFDRFKRLDILVGNAGMLGGLQPTAQVDPALWDRVFALNVTANLRLIRTCDPLLRASTSGRAIFVTSRAAHVFRPFWAAYSASKAALEALAQTYAAELEHTNVKVHVFDPGKTRTAMRAQAYPGEDPATLPDPGEVAAKIAALCI
jgi:NAD(P)-dependent dehydrogenase (short-subunit alcohol dehydrogenase family)